MFIAPKDLKPELLGFTCNDPNVDLHGLEDGGFATLQTTYDGTDPLTLEFEGTVVVPLRESSFENNKGKWFLELAPMIPKNEISNFNKIVAQRAIELEDITGDYVIKSQITAYGNIVISFTERTSLSTGDVNPNAEVCRVDGAPTTLEELKKALKIKSKVSMSTQVGVYMTKKGEKLHIGCFFTRQNFNRL
jgi:hypothetical protein